MKIEHSRHCPKCGEFKEIADFYHDRTTKTGLTVWCKDCCKSSGLTSRGKRKEAIREYAHKHYVENKDIKRLKFQNRRKAIFIKIFDLLGNKCVWCGFSNKIALEIDHKVGGSYADLKRLRNNWYGYYKEVLENIDNFQLLCSNCNRIKSVEYGKAGSVWIYPDLA